MSGGFITNSSTVTQTLQRTGVLSSVATSSFEDTDGTAGDSAGDSMFYKISLNNTGTTTLTTIVVSSAVLVAQERWVL